MTGDKCSTALERKKSCWKLLCERRKRLRKALWEKRFRLPCKRRERLRAAIVEEKKGVKFSNDRKEAYELLPERRKAKNCLWEQEGVGLIVSRVVQMPQKEEREGKGELVSQASSRCDMLHQQPVVSITMTCGQILSHEEHLPQKFTTWHKIRTISYLTQLMAYLTHLVRPILTRPSLKWSG